MNQLLFSTIGKLLFCREMSLRGKQKIFDGAY